MVSSCTKKYPKTIYQVPLFLWVLYSSFRPRWPREQQKSMKGSANREVYMETNKLCTNRSFLFMAFFCYLCSNMMILVAEKKTGGEKGNMRSQSINRERIYCGQNVGLIAFVLFGKEGDLICLFSC